MKKFLCVILSCLMLLSLVACGSEDPTTTTTLTMTQNGVTIDYELEAKGDVVVKITQTSTLDGSLFTEEQIDAMLEAATEYEATYEAIDGVTYTLEENGGNLVETITIDASSADTIQALSDSGMLPVDTEGATSISLEKTVENLESLGMTIKE